MDARFDPRYPADFEVWITDLQNQGYSSHGIMRDISESGVCVVTPLQLRPGDIVRMDVGDSVLFGFVTHCSPAGGSAQTSTSSATWRTGIEIQKVLMGGSDLSQLLRQVLREQMPALASQDAANPVPVRG